MCIIIVKEVNTKLNKTELEASIKVAQKHNCHGAGFAVKKADSGLIHVSKGYLFHYELMLKSLYAYDIQEDDEVIVHLRFATSGKVNQINCHPFVVDEDLDTILLDEATVNLPVMAHNGTFYEFSDKKDSNSDTVNFVKDFLALPNVLDSIESIWDANPYLADNIIGNNRVSIMYPEANRQMLLLGDWNYIKKGSWVYSNYYHTNPYDGYRKPGVHNYSTGVYN